MPPVRKAKTDAAMQTKQLQAESLEKNLVVSGQLQKKIKKQQQKVKEKRGIVFIKHLPHGFFEQQLKNYFEQFGTVTRLRLSRSRRTGGSKGFAFVEFEYPEVAEIAAETMDNYLMFQKLVKAAYIPPEKQIYNYFKSSVRKVQNKAGKSIYVSNKTTSIQSKANRHNDWSDSNYQKRTMNQLKKVNKLKNKYADLGIDFSNILIEPKDVTAEVKSSKNVTVSEAELETSPAAGKRKLKENTKKNAGKLVKAKKGKKEVQLQDLLGNTIHDDTDDEDYIAIPESDDDDSVEEDDDASDAETAASSDEETYGFTKDSDDEAEVMGKGKNAKSTKNTAKTYGKLLKPSKVNRFEQLVQRKPQTGRVQKAKKTSKPAPAKKFKNSVQVAAAKELLQSLPKVKANINAKAKLGKKQKSKK